MSRWPRQIFVSCDTRPALHPRTVVPVVIFPHWPPKCSISFRTHSSSPLRSSVWCICSFWNAVPLHPRISSCNFPLGHAAKHQFNFLLINQKVISGRVKGWYQRRQLVAHTRAPCFWCWWQSLSRMPPFGGSATNVNGSNSSFKENDGNFDSWSSANQW